MCAATARDRKSTRLNSSHLVISYAVFCLKKKNAGPNLKIDRSAIQQAVDDDEGDAEYQTPEVKSGDTAGRAGGRVGNCKRGKMARHEGIESWKGGANCSILEHFVRFVLPLAGRFIALNNIRARTDFPSSHKSSVNC